MSLFFIFDHNYERSIMSLKPKTILRSEQFPSLYRGFSCHTLLGKKFVGIESQWQCEWWSLHKTNYMNTPIQFLFNLCFWKNKEHPYVLKNQFYRNNQLPNKMCRNIENKKSQKHKTHTSIHKIEIKPNQKINFA